MLKVFLKKGRSKPIAGGHPWIFSGAIRRVEGDGRPGDPCSVHDEDGCVLGHGYFNASSSITVRMLTSGDREFTTQTLGERLQRAVDARSAIFAGGATDSGRLVNAEGDFLPGLAVDRFAGGLGVQIATAGMEKMRASIMEALESLCAPSFIFDRSDTDSRRREGLASKVGLIQGTLPDPLIIKENGMAFSVDISEGQKTGFYFDQRENRALARKHASGRRCLDCFSYSGAFCINLLAGGAASVTAVDISKSAIEQVRKNIEINRFAFPPAELLVSDVFEYLRSADRQFELIVLDPPKFARHPNEVIKAARGYKDINLQAMKKIGSGGLLFTFSCSNAVDQKLFRQIVFSAAADAGRKIQLLQVLSAGPDHPVNIAHLEGEYLKGLFLRIW